jgi:uncharacterized protein with von Willebrand factor type A (vWA) domain
MHETSDSVAASIVAFCRYARSNGLPVGMQQTLTALEAAKAVGVADRPLFAYALRAVLCSSHEEWELFDRLFEAFWVSRRGFLKTRAGKNESSGTETGPPKDAQVLMSSASNAPSPDGKGKMVSGASSQQRLKKMDFSEAPYSDLAALEQLSLRLLRQMGLRLSRRLKIESLADRVDLRRTIRRNITHGGDPFVLAYKGRKPQPRRLVIFLDVSGSMNLYSLFLVRFAYALQKHFKHVDTFLFSTSVVEVSDALRAQKLSDALKGLSEKVADWSGGTKIGGSLREFNRRHGRRVLSRATVFIILSDGWDTGEPQVLAAELRSARRRVEKLIWLNPLLGLKEYQPITRGMSAALPHVDVFAPAHNLESLLALERYL